MSEEVNGMVSDCVYYTREGACDNNGYYSYWCEDNPECYYKQLQRTKVQYNAVVEQNRSLQQELQKKNRTLNEIEKIAEKILEQLKEVENEKVCKMQSLR